MLQGGDLRNALSSEGGQELQWWRRGKVRAPLARLFWQLCRVRAHSEGRMCAVLVLLATLGKSTLAKSCQEPLSPQDIWPSAPSFLAVPCY